MANERPKFGPETYPAGSVIIQQGDIPDKFYIIVRGEVEVLDQPPDGLDIVIDRLGSGDYFGEVGLVKSSRRIATVRATTPVEVMTMDRLAFENWLKSSDVIQEEINSVVEQRLSNFEKVEFLEQEERLRRSHTPTNPNEKVTFDPAAMPPIPTDTGVQQFESGTLIIRQGDLPDKFYILVDGMVEVFQQHQGREVVISYLASGSYFGEIGLLDNEPRTASVRALSRVKVLVFDRDTFQRWLKRSPDSEEAIQETAQRRRKDTGMLTPLPEEGQF